MNSHISLVSCLVSHVQSPAPPTHPFHPVYTGAPKSSMGPGLLSALAAAGYSMALLTEPLPGSWDIFVNHCVSGSNTSADMEGRSTRQCSDLIWESRLQLLSSVIRLCVNVCVCVCVCVLGPHKTESLGSRKITRFHERAYTEIISPLVRWGCQGPHCIHTSNCFMTGQARLLPPGRP